MSCPHCRPPEQEPYHPTCAPDQLFSFPVRYGPCHGQTVTIPFWPCDGQVERVIDPRTGCYSVYRYSPYTGSFTPV